MWPNCKKWTYMKSRQVRDAKPPARCTPLLSNRREVKQTLAQLFNWNAISDSLPHTAMPYSPIFQGFIRTTASAATLFLTMSLRGPPFISSHITLRARRPSLLSISTRHQALGSRCFYVSPNIRSQLGVVRSVAPSRTTEVDWKERQGVGFRRRSIALPFWHQQSSNYGRFAYQDVSSDDSDVESGSSQQQLVSIMKLPFFIGQGLYFPSILYQVNVW